MKLQFVAKKPSYKDYPTELNTLGDHLRKARLDRNLSQPQVAKTLGVVTDTIACWEMNRNAPTAKFAKKIIEFMGYIPIEWKDNPLHLRLFYARISTGLSQAQLASRLNSDTSNLSMIEKGSCIPQKQNRMKILTFIKDVLGA